MTDHPLLFSAPMVRAILDGRKTQTRRVVSPRNSLVNGGKPCMKHDPAIISAWPNLDFGDAFVDPGPSPSGNEGPYLKVAGAERSRHRIYPRMWRDDRIWVRETWQLARPDRNSEGVVDDEVLWSGPIPTTDPRGRRSMFDDWCLGYAANGADGPWRRSIFMPRWASRITLKLTSVRPERLQDITAADAIAEGIDIYGGHLTLRAEFAELWQRINGKRPGCAWDDNPWVWVLSWSSL